MSEHDNALIELAKLLQTCLGPLPSHYILSTKETNKAVITGAGVTVASQLINSQCFAGSPLVRVAFSGLEAYGKRIGDGVTSAVIMVAAGLQHARRFLGDGQFAAPRASLLAGALAEVRRRYTDQEIVPCLLRMSHGMHSVTEDQEEESNNSSSDGDEPSFSDKIADYRADLFDTMRQIITTSLCGQFTPPAEKFLADALLDWVNAAASHVAKTSREGDKLERNADDALEKAREELLAGARYLRRNPHTLLLHRGGGGLSDTRLISDGVMLQKVAAEGNIYRSTGANNNSRLRFVPMKCSPDLEADDVTGSFAESANIIITDAPGATSARLYRIQCLELIVAQLVRGGVRLVLCTRMLPQVFIGLCRAHSIQCIQHLEDEDCDYLCDVYGIEPVLSCIGGIELTEKHIGVAQGVRHISMGTGTVAGAPLTYVFGGSVIGCQLVVRAPSEGLAVEYSTSLLRCLCLTIHWLEWSHPACVSPSAPELQCPIVGGGCASELALYFLFTHLADQHKNNDTHIHAHLHKSPRGVGMFHGHTLMVEALSLLACAMLAVPTALLHNITRATGSALSRTQPSMLRLLPHLETLHSTGLPWGLIAPSLIAQEVAPSEEKPLLSVGCGLDHGIVHPVALKVSQIGIVIETLILLLRTDGVPIMVKKKKRGQDEEQDSDVDT